MKTFIKRIVLKKCRRQESVFACIALIALVSGSAEGLITPSNQTNPCLTVECIRTATEVMEKMNTKINPCDDFYQFACGNFIEETQIPEDSVAVHTFFKIIDELQLQLYDIIREERPEADLKHFKLPNALYKGCMDKNLIQSLGTEPIQRIAKSLGGWPVTDCYCWDSDDSWTWQKTVKEFRRLGFGSDYILNVVVEVDQKDNTKHIITLDNPSVGFDIESLVEGFDEPLVIHYYNYMVDIAVLFGADRETAEKELKKSLQFEIDLARISLLSAQSDNPNDYYNLRSIKQLQESYPYVQWMDFINGHLPKGIRVTEDEIVNLKVPSFYEDLGKLLRNTYKRRIADYLMWRIHEWSLDLLPDEFVTRKWEFLSAMSGEKQQEDVWKKCVDTVSKSFAIPVGALYVRKHYKEDSSGIVLEMFTNIRKAFDQILDRTEWMNSTTRLEAKKKLSLMTAHVGYPNEILNDTLLAKYYQKLKNIDPSKYFKSTLRINVFNDDIAFNKLRLPVNKNDWLNFAKPATVNAFYSVTGNSIELPAGFLQGYLFNSERPKYMNYGGIGNIIAHELTHGFDNLGRKYNADGNLVDWWDPATEEAFTEKAKCIIKQYSNYTDKQTELNIDGDFTQNENIADNGAIKETYMAYKQLVTRNGEELQLPGLNYTALQMYWIATTQTWCSKFRTEFLQREIAREPHATFEFRTLGPLKNMPDFSSDFGCDKGTPMNPDDKCEVW